ncbi:LysR substrate-binding domain-containing protein [Burkholderia gladioli pv. gladioli]|uniref:Bacterial regulatory helix-turn-helix, lysR family protein n=1 Tax=Burkholderia gladioli TaxID=28095 RepID=A0A095F1S6_BURGA|nr:LysR substrate-binding domain-containing protein [Burkholderia gladioli]AJW99046.1 bacterial regulatory helix-turn-helix, lysR family protein [Burkholderia gladioli]ASD79919.1 LysR family transcriptional regulator [Burkholderia gladioli pv. gladioli]AWY54839.1 LysR family transcriptional regulator [Burkholderia gladioli pv. gladioli]KGC11596.1 bacterial regulatory helix-turn-helix, lysR family protein [Burkholderia gladioli]MDJ1164160.1 LysR substrate-binding domain-containing protein [Burk
MTINFKLLKSFVAAIELESLSGAASHLHIAQPALSQHVNLLEKHFGQKLLIRTNVGVQPTHAGKELYRHALAILDQLDKAEIDVARSANVISGNVRVGFATYSTTSSILSIPLLKAIRRDYPDINLFLNDNFGLVLSEMVFTGRMDMAIIYASQPIKGVVLQPLLDEELFLIAPPHMDLPPDIDGAIPLTALESVELLLPGRTHFLRQMIEKSFADAGVRPLVAAEIESEATLRDAIEAGLGATILPWALASTFSETQRPLTRRLIEPTLRATVSLCVSDSLPVSEAAQAVRGALAQLVSDLVAEQRFVGVSAPAHSGAPID